MYDFDRASVYGNSLVDRNIYLDSSGLCIEYGTCNYLSSRFDLYKFIDTIFFDINPNEKTSDTKLSSYLDSIFIHNEEGNKYSLIPYKQDYKWNNVEKPIAIKSVNECFEKFLDFMEDNNIPCYRSITTYTRNLIQLPEKRIIRGWKPTNKRLTFIQLFR